jgi:hypothetical protein
MQRRTPDVLLAKTWLLASIGLVLLADAASGQNPSGKAFARYKKPLGSLTLDLDTGTLTRGPRAVDRTGNSITDFDNLDLGGFSGVDTGNGFCRWIDAAVKGTGAGRTAGVNNTSDLMNSIVFAYCSSKLTPGSGGPGGSLALQFYEGYTLFGGAATTGVALFTLTGLPGNSASSSFFGGFTCYFMRVVFGQLVCFADGPIGYGWKFLDAGFQTANPLSSVLAGTWPFLSCVASCSGSILQIDHQGMTDVIDEYCPPSVLRPCTFCFGTTSGTFTSIAMSIQEVIDQTATITASSGIPAAPDVLSATAAAVGSAWTATVTSGLARTKAGTWTLFFGKDPVAQPTGFDIGQFPPSGGNFGTTKAGRRLLCGIDALNPSACRNIPLAAGLGSSSACTAMIPKKIGLVCNSWCGQALVLGTVPASLGGGNARLTNAIGGTVGTNP